MSRVSPSQTVHSLMTSNTAVAVCLLFLPLNYLSHGHERFGIPVILVCEIVLILFSKVRSFVNARYYEVVKFIF